MSGGSPARPKRRTKAACGTRDSAFASSKAQRFLLSDAVAEAGGRLIGEAMFRQYNRWPVYSKFFDNMGPIPHHMHQGFADAKLVGQEGKPESYYFPPQLNNVDNNFAYTFMGLEPGTTKAQVRKCLEDWSKGDNGILDLSRAYRLKRGSGWLIPPGVLHAPGSLCTYEPQWGSDVFGMYQSLVEGREVPWSLLVKDMPPEKHQDLDFIVGQLDWERNVDTHFKEHNYLEPIVDAERSGDGYTDRWIVYGTIDGQQLFSSKELTLEPGAKCTLRDPGASGWITVQGRGRIGRLAIQTPVDDPLRRRHGRRGIHHARSGPAWRHRRKHRQRTARGLTLLRPGRASEPSGLGRVSQINNPSRRLVGAQPTCRTANHGSTPRPGTRC